jgi:hypothetical protein
MILKGRCARIDEARTLAMTVRSCLPKIDPFAKCICCGRVRARIVMKHTGWHTKLTSAVEPNQNGADGGIKLDLVLSLYRFGNEVNVVSSCLTSAQMIIYFV